MPSFDIRLQKVIPSFLADVSNAESEVWNTDLHFRSGTHSLVLAQSGKGKSTLLGLIFGARGNYQGDITFDQDNIRKFDLNHWSELRKSQISMLFQELRLFDLLTVKENLKLKLELSTGIEFAETMEWLDVLGMADFADRQCKTLSFGQQQRIAIVRALCQPFSWLLMDEPFSHLDENNIALALELIKKRCDQSGAGLIITSLGSKHNYPFHQFIRL